MEYASWKRDFSEERDARTYHKVFDAQTVAAVHFLATKRHFVQIEHPISEGKEAVVFRANDGAGGFRAIKVYKIATSTFHRMQPYITGDPRFKRIKRSKRDVVLAWAQKEYKNLLLAQRAGVRAPVPVAVRENALVMEFVGDAQGNPAPRLRDAPRDLDMEDVYAQVVENFARLLYGAKLVHGDLSTYNMLYDDGKIVFIDMGQAVTLSHPKALDFLERDIKNMAAYFKRKGMDTDADSFKADVKAKKGKEK